jgi:AcrR family transcriptional regulator
MSGAGSTDRRVRRTRGLLHEALASLIHEKSYDAIVVKEILGRADVGRSTFYAHFRDKDELLVSGIHDLLRASAPTPGRGSTTPTSRADWILRFSLPVLEHVEAHLGRRRDAGDSGPDARGHAVVHEHLQRVLADLVLADLFAAGLRRADRGRAQSGRALPPELLARHVASTFVLALTWWAESRDPLPAVRANDDFRALVLPTLTDALG